MSSASTHIYRLLDRDSIYDSIFDNLTPGNIFRLGRTSRLSQLAVRDYKRRAWNIDKHLRRYFTDPIGFRALQAQTSLIISGSSAVQFFDRDFYPHSDLDLYVDLKDAATVCSWIEEHGGKGYRLKPTEHQKSQGWKSPQDILDHFDENVWPLDAGAMESDDDDFEDRNSYGENEVKAVLNFLSDSDTESRPMQIQVIVGRTSPFASILNFHSTVVMNVLTYAAAYSFFPHESFDNRRAAKKHATTAVDALQKYSDRGWEFISNILPTPASSATNSEFQHSVRDVGDSSTWVLPFDTTGVKDRLGPIENTLLTPLSCDPFTINSFNVIATASGIQMEFEVIDAPCFHNSYTANIEFTSKLSTMALLLLKSMQEIPSLTLVKRNDRALLIFKDVCRKLCECDYEKKPTCSDLHQCKAYSRMKLLSGLLLYVPGPGEELIDKLDKSALRGMVDLNLNIRRA